MKIQSTAHYESLMEEILGLMNKGEANLSYEEHEKLRILSLAAQSYEQSLIKNKKNQ